MCGLLAALLAGVPVSAPAASSAVGVVISRLQVGKSAPNVVYLKLETPPTGMPACSAHYWRYTLLLALPFDDKVFATLLAAYAGGIPVNVSGTGTCGEHPQIESLYAVELAR